MDLSVLFLENENETNPVPPQKNLWMKIADNDLYFKFLIVFIYLDHPATNEMMMNMIKHHTQRHQMPVSV